MEINWDLFYKRCFESITQRDIHSLVKLGYDITGLPFNIQDSSLKILSMEPNTPQEDSLWEMWFTLIIKFLFMGQW